jgi:hypothetical protein
MDPFYMEDEKVYEKIENFVSAMKVHDKFISKK